MDVINAAVVVMLLWFRLKFDFGQLIGNKYFFTLGHISLKGGLSFEEYDFIILVFLFAKKGWDSRIE